MQSVKNTSIIGGRTTVEIVGSKPNVLLLGAETVYCANGAIRYAKRMGSKSTVTHVSSVSFTRRLGALELPPKSEFHRKEVEEVKRSMAARMIIFNTGNRCSQSMIDRIRNDFSIMNLRVFVDSELNMIMRSVVGSVPPFGLLQGLGMVLKHAGISEFFKLMSRFVRMLAKRIRGKQTRVPSFFRPSTGVLALIVAIYETGGVENYVLSGIGLDRWNYTKEINGYETPRKHQGLPNHYIADKVLLKRLRKIVRLRTTDLDLSQALDIPLIYVTYGAQGECQR